MLMYQYFYYHFIGGNGYGTRRTRYGPLFTDLDVAKRHLENQRSASFYAGFVNEYLVNSNQPGKIVYKTNEDVPVDEIA
jgi:hypothetical protein